MPKLYTDWHDLNDDLLKTDIPTIDGKRERFKTVIFEVDQIHYDPSIPILSDSQLERWLKSKHQRTREREISETVRDDPRNEAIVESESSTKSSDVDEDSSDSSGGGSSSSSEDISSGSSEDSSNSSKGSSDSSDVTGKVRSEPVNNDCNLRNVSEEEQTSERPNNIGGLINGHTCITLDTSDDEEEENESDVHIHSMWKSATDELVIREEIDDEFKRFADDDDEVESEMTKNLKKIRSEPPIAKQPPPPNVSKPNVTTRSPIVTKTPSVVQPPDAVKESNPPPPAPTLPDWPNTEKSLKANNFYFVYRDLAHFKKHIPTSPEAIKLCQESVIKCCQEDETNYLRQIIELMFELELPDIDVWAELVPRIKRKLSPGTRFKTKVDSKIIFQNYETILVSVREHAAVKNLILRLPFGTMQWFIGYNNKPEQRLEQKPDTTQLLPLQTSGRFIVNLPDLKPKTIKIEPKNVDPDRKVTMINNEAGKTTFKITNTKKDKKPFRYRL